MYFNKHWVNLLIYFIVTAETLKNTKTNGKYEEDTESNVQRRFLEDLDDKEWHISHLRDMEFDTEKDCDDNTFEKRAKKYRETLRNDAALVEFVSGDVLQNDKQDISSNKCNHNITNIFKVKKVKTELKPNVTVTSDKLKNYTSSDGDVKTATVSMNEKKHQGESKSNTTNKRRSEYQFSSVEYYDEVPDFDHSICPDTVDVITLELDQLRNYDVECEAILEWRSLE